MSRPGRLVALAAIWALVATACTGGDATTSTTTTADGAVANTAATSTAAPVATAAPGAENASPPPPPPGPVLAGVEVEPPVTMPGDAITVTSPIEGRLEVVGPGGVVAETELTGEAATITLPAGTADGEYLLVVRSDTRQLALGAVRIASEPGLWASADRTVASDDELVRVRVTALGLSPDTAVMVGLGEGWEDELSWDAADDSEDSSDDSSEELSGPAGTLTATEQGLLIDAGLGETTLLSDLTGRDLFLPGTNADAIQLVVFGDELRFSEVLPLAQCNDPATVVGSIGGSGGVRFVAASGDLESVAAVTADGTFSVALAAGPHLLTGWLDGEPPAPITPIPLDVPCGGTVRVGAAPAEPPPAETAPPLIVEDAFAVAQPPCRTFTVTEIVGPDDAVLPGITQAVAGTLRASLPRAEVVVLDDIEAMVDLTFDPLWSVRPGTVVHLGGVGERFAGNAYVTGVRHSFDGTLATHPGTDGDLAVSRSLAAGTEEWVSGFAADVAASALCIDAAPLHLAAGETASWPVTVTDLAGAHADGAVVEVAGAESGELAPSTATVAAGPASFTYSAGPGTNFENLTVHASMGDRGPEASATFAAGSGFTYVLAGSRSIGTVDATEVLPVAGELGFDLWACSPRPGGPYSGWFIVHDAGFTGMSTLLMGLVGGMLSVAGSAPAGGSPDNPFLRHPLADPGRDLSDMTLVGPGGELPGFLGGGVSVSEFVFWVFGHRSEAFAEGGAVMGLFAVEFLLALASSDSFTEDGIIGRIDDAYFERGEITLLSSSEGSLVGALNPATGSVGVRTRGGWADGTWIMRTALLPFAEAPDGCRFSDAG